MHPSVDAYIFNSSPEHQKILLAVRKLILSLSPKIEEVFSYKVPFYRYHSALCYLSISKNQVYIGFVKGAMLEDEAGILHQGDRKQIAVVVFKNGDAIPIEALRSLLLQSMILLEDKHKAKNSTRKR
jgi:hypothetical protein